MRFQDGQFLTVEKIGPRRSKTPEGYLLCEAVPISRVGTFEYSAVEAGIQVPAGQKALMSRTADELFSPTTMASFEGKPVVIGHARFADPSNWKEISVGTVQNVRRGDGDVLLADLLLTDEKGIALVEGGKLEEVSCGYDARSVDDGEGRGHQEGIVGNHVALVERARCGPICKIGDGFMTKPKTWKAALRRLFKDGDEEAFNDALDTMPNEHADEESAPKTDADPAPAPTAEERLVKLEAAVAALSEQVEKLMAVEKDEGHPELQGDEDPEQKADEETVADEDVCDDEVKAVMADAEDLCPGVERPQGDVADGKYSRALLERVKRNALKGSGVKFFGDSAELRGEALDVAFRGAVALKRARRNPTAKPFGDMAGSRMSNADLNSKFKSFWEAK